LPADADPRWQRIEALFDAAIDLPEDDRAAYLAGECRDDDALRREVESMLTAHQRAGGILDRAVAPLASRALAEHLSAGEGSRNGARDEEPRRRQVGPYRLLRRAGRGGMGEVWQAFDERLDRFVALKFLPEELAGHAEAKARFVDEARAASRLDHPSICTVYDVGDDEEGNLFIAMAFYEGRTLADRLGEGPLPVAEAVELAIRAAEGLGHAHAAGIVHRDVKPSNLMITGRGELKILDFGIAKLSVGATAVTRSGMQVGTLSYMSPEQARGAPVDGRSDLWSLGVVLYEALTGERPFQRGSAYGTVEAILGAEARPLGELRQEAGPELERVVHRALAKKPEERWPSAGELAAALRAAGETTRTAAVAAPQRPAVRRAANLLPAPLTSFVGRRREIELLVDLLGEARLITLTGPAGSGKSRLALETARRVAGRFDHGARFVPLASVEDPELVPTAIARALGVTVALPRPPLSLLTEALGDSEMLLVLDNFEHLGAAAPLLARLLAACAGLRVLVTSQVVLRVSGEHTFPVPPLELPPRDAATAEELAASPSAELFVERARAVRPDLSLGAAEAAAVAEICIRLEGMPLALELAASRVRLFSPRELLSRLGSRLDLPAADHRDRPARHRTLRAALDWSHDLLSEDERALFRRLSVFVGSFPLSVAEAVGRVGNGLGGDPLEVLASLADHSLLRREEAEGEPRFLTLETIRDYGGERLAEAGEVAAARQAHAVAFLALAERAQPGLTGPQQAAWLDRLEQDRANLRAAMAWAEENAEPETGLRLVAALWRFWLVRGPLADARERVSRLLALPGADEPTALRAAALDALGTLNHNLGDNQAARGLLEESLALYRGLDAPQGVADELTNLAWVACELSDLETAVRLSEEALALHRELGEERGQALVLNNLGWVANYRGRYREARSFHEASLALRESIGDQRGIAFALTSLAWAEQYHGAHTRALALLARAEQILRPVSDQVLYAFLLLVRVRVLRDRGMARRAEEILAGHRKLWREVGNRSLTAWQLTFEGGVACDLGELERAGELLAQAVEIWRDIGTLWGEAMARFEQGMVARRCGDLGRARRRFRISLELRHQVGDLRGVAESLEAMAVFGDEGAGASGDGDKGGAEGETGGGVNDEVAVRWLAAAAALRDEVEAPASVLWEPEVEERVEELRERLGERFAAPWDEGRLRAAAVVEEVVGGEAGSSSR